MGYSFANPWLKLDTIGWSGIAEILGSATTPCTVAMGMKYSDFLSTCVQTTGDKQKDQTRTR